MSTYIKAWHVVLLPFFLPFGCITNMTLKRGKCTSTSSHSKTYFYARKDVKITKFNILMLQMKNSSLKWCPRWQRYLVRQLRPKRMSSDFHFKPLVLYLTNLGRFLLFFSFFFFPVFVFQFKTSDYKYVSKFGLNSFHNFQKRILNTNRLCQRVQTLKEKDVSLIPKSIY